MGPLPAALTIAGERYSSWTGPGRRPCAQVHRNRRGESLRRSDPGFHGKVSMGQPSVAALAARNGVEADSVVTMAKVSSSVGRNRIKVLRREGYEPQTILARLEHRIGGSSDSDVGERSTGSQQVQG